MISGTLSLRFKPSASRPPAPMLSTRPTLRLPARSAATPPAPASWRAQPTCPPAAPVLSPEMADTIRDTIPSQSFLDTFDELLDQQDPADPDPAVRPADRAVLRSLLTYRWCADRPTPDELAARLDRDVRYIRQSIHRLRQAVLLPCGHRL